MSLKQIIKRSKILNPAFGASLVLPGEPTIYCIKYNIANRTRSVNFFRNMKFESLLKCFFPRYMKTDTPVVVLVRLFVTPPSSEKISLKKLKSESIPAVFAYELADYMLSFIEMLHHVLINSYKQIVKIDIEKFYSDVPRTVFKFMRWDHYVDFQNQYTIHSEGKGICKDGKVRLLQPERARDEADKGLCNERAKGRKQAKSAI